MRYIVVYSRSAIMKDINVGSLNCSARLKVTNYSLEYYIDIVEQLSYSQSAHKCIVTSQSAFNLVENL